MSWGLLDDGLVCDGAGCEGGGLRVATWWALDGAGVEKEEEQQRLTE